jgi:lactate dehydrogenase-like 2-hydroxyacid dehydrogenase
MHPHLANSLIKVEVLLLTTPGGSDTAAIVDRDVIDRLGPEGIIVNVARGSVVDQSELVEALVVGRLGGAALESSKMSRKFPQSS